MITEDKRIKPVLAAGLGNPLASDEGVGIVLIERLSALAGSGGPAPDTVEYLDAGTGGMKLLHKLDGRKKLILIDCAKMGREPGTICRFTPDDVKSVKHLTGQSLHEMDLLKLLSLAGLMGCCPEEVVIFGIEPACIDLGQGLSDRLNSRLDDYIKAIVRELAGPAVSFL